MRRALLLLGAMSLLTGVLAGLARLGVAIGWGPRYAHEHGPLLVLGAFATIISLERAVAYGRWLGLLAPGLGATGAAAALGGLTLSAWALTASTVALVLLNAAIVRRQSALFTWLMLLGSISLAFSAVVWLQGAAVSRVVLGWMAFFLLTIVSERLELSRLARTPAWAAPMLALLSASVAALAAAACLGISVSRPLGAVLTLIAAWQLRFDVARHLLRRGGLPAFSASAVLAGAAWVLVAGVLLLIEPLPSAGPGYDAVIHAVFIGYVLSMVFAHAPIIVPAVARVEVPFHRALYGSLILLHGGMVLRVVGDLAGPFELRQAGALANAVALGVFVFTILLARVSRRPARRGLPAK